MMRLKTMLAGCGLLLSSVVMAQTEAGKAADGSKIMKGKVELKTMTSDPELAWFHTGINKYEAKETQVNLIKANNTKYKFVAITSTWDAAGKKLLPQFYKIMIMASVPETNFEAYAVDQNQHSGTKADDRYKVKTAPAIVVLKEGKEVGRINGEPSGALEDAIAGIIMKTEEP
ncbi:hypothetical protein MKQ68_23685 [Chitinophaga horti]|uniref:Thioredoxin domain-containing protein n=1 Tax=Chitinophaga horti TaxID=2920382 RepID=A0ABY6J0B1_9BACT|nr:hypothetical protein [Chitinophaga horti]UYQ93087.1 hypothetical protein MKQ68_23685 [Chitinophaga horti]